LVSTVQLMYWITSLLMDLIKTYEFVVGQLGFRW